MRVPLEWLKEYINIDASADNVAEILTIIGHEVEAIEKFEDDVVFEVNVTPNRPDCLSIFGIARELSAYYKAPVKFPEHGFSAETGGLDFNIDILDPDLCNRYAGRIVKKVRIDSSPQWMRKRLEKCGIRAINNIVDITNYVLLELGHPLHAFDLKTLKGSRIRIGTPETVVGKGTILKTKTLDGVEREIPSNSLLIWDAEEPVAIAGVMGGLDTEVKSGTENIFIESAYFNPVSIRKTSKSLGLKTESSYRFERGADIRMLKKALERSAFLMKELAGGQICGKIDMYPKLYSPNNIVLRYKKVNSVLGLNLSSDDIEDCLKGLGFELHQNPEFLNVKPPAFRGDIQREIDLIEEIARLYGYDKIPAEMPKASIGFDNTQDRLIVAKNNVKEAIRTSCLKKGFNEVVNFSFMGAEDLDMLKIEEGDERRRSVKIMNPLRVEDSYMRTTLTSSLIKNIQYNLAHGNRDLRLFEISRVFIQKDASNAYPDSKDSKLPDEKTHLAVACYREKIKNLYKDDAHDFYLMKGLIEAILNSLKISDCSFVRSSEQFLHPGQSADLYVSKSRAGFIGMLAPFIISSLDIKAYKPQISVLELNLDLLITHSAGNIVYKPLSRYPYIERDTAIIVDSSLESSLIKNMVREYPSDLLEDAYIFDVYQGDNIPEGRKSIAFNIRYRASDRTLKDDDVDTLHKSLVEYILNKTKGQLRA